MNGLTGGTVSATEWLAPQRVASGDSVCRAGLILDSAGLGQFPGGRQGLKLIDCAEPSGLARGEVEVVAIEVA